MSGLKRIVAHWTAGTHRVSSIDRDHYHFIYDGDGKEHAGNHKPEANIRPVRGKYAAHTLNLNTGSIGVSVACMHNATERNFGKYAMTEVQFDAMCRGIARLCAKYGIPVTKKTVLSHAEVQPTLGIRQRGKWDFTVLPFMPGVKGAVACGDEMRRRVRLYMKGENASTGPDERTRWLQSLLREEGFNIVADGWAGSKTVNAVKAFEAKHGLPETGSFTSDKTVALLRARAEERRMAEKGKLADSAPPHIVHKPQDMGEEGDPVPPPPDIPKPDKTPSQPPQGGFFMRLLRWLLGGSLK